MDIKKYFLSLRRLAWIFVVATGIFLPATGFAATLNFIGDKDVLAVGDTYNVDVKVNSQDQGMNAAQATIKFNQTVLTVDHVDKTGSTFTYWLAEPSINNTAGTVSFIGGASNGFSGKSMQALRIVFKAKGTGTTRLSFDDAAVTASDGTGTNILSSTRGLDIKSVTLANLIATSGPELITRRPELALQLPAAPEVIVPLYPKATDWYNVTQNFSATWKLPADIASVGTIIDKNPLTDPTKAQGLFTNENFIPLDNGMWYLHVRFKNSIGWGPTTHYRIAIDTVPPSSFEIKNPSGVVTDNPSQVLAFVSFDQLSGMHGYEVRVDGGATVVVATTTFKLPALAPGTHRVTVTAKDIAGNATLATTDVIVRALAAPQVLSISRDVFAGEGALALNGTATPDSQVRVSVRNDVGQEVEQGLTHSLADGSWSISIDHPLKEGAYSAEIVIQDARGATSVPVKTPVFLVRARPFLIFGGVEITQTIFFLVVILLLAFGFFLGSISQRKQKQKRSSRVIVTERDIASAFEFVRKELGGALDRFKGKRPSSTEADEYRSIVKRVHDRMNQVEKYILDNVEDINK